MNIAYPISEILKCVEIINQPKKKFYKSNDKTFEQRLTLFESRVKDNESEVYRQKKYDERINI